jgi:polyribonucleotide nucleotidyltransferase
VENVEEVLAVGQKVQVQISEIDPRGKLSLVPVLAEESGDGEGQDGPASVQVDEPAGANA